MENNSLEQVLCDDYLRRSKDECKFESWFSSRQPPASLILAEGFEEHTLGVLEKIKKLNIEISEINIGRYGSDLYINEEYRERLEKLAELVAPGQWKVSINNEDGQWIREAIENSKNREIILDITSISHRGIFDVLDAASLSNKKIFIGYSEADQYWPKKDIWQDFLLNLFFLYQFSTC